jgi:HD-GYP domain-containing protein (c-di-GMP phosphodiesterase class II)
MTSDRPYRAARSRAEAIQELHRCSGTQFEPAIVDAFCAEIAESTPDEPASTAVAAA